MADFGGRLTAAEIPLLPTVLEELILTTDGEGLKALATRLPRLKKLRFLCKTRGAVGMMARKSGF